MDNKERLIFEGLNSQQADAVGQTEGPVLIVAGAGSGKTKVLTCRIANILSKGTEASRVLALTFTKKAASEMKERIAAMVGSRTSRSLAMGTFHSVFIRFLRDYADFLGYPREFTIYDTSDSISLIKTCLKELNLDDKVYKPKTVLGRISEAKNNLASPAAYISNPSLTERDSRSKMPRIAEVYDLYWKKCRASGVMDFDDILFEMNILFRDNKAALDEIASRFDYVLVDEYQDTNRAQYLILTKLSQQHRNICVVGDDSQSIYAFRGARIENILNFKKDYPDCHIYRLEQNYRSTRIIVDAANSLIAHNEGRIPKKCFSQGEEGEKIHIIQAYTEQEEASLLVSSIVYTIRNKSAQYQDFAVLYRTNAQSRAIEEALRRANIPYIIYSGNSFFERAEVRDLMAYFKLVCNPSDDESFKRVVNKPARGIGDTSMDALIRFAYENRITLMEACLSPQLSLSGLKNAAITRMREFAMLINELGSRAATENAYTLAMDIAMKSGIWIMYKSDTSVEGQARFGNVEELCNSVQAYIEQCEAEEYENAIAAGQDTDSENEAGTVVTLFNYLENIALLSAVDTDDDSSNKVALMTVHSSKGLEFPYVYVAGMEENLFPSVNNTSRPSEVEEERRLFYVAITRARKAVRLSYAQTRMRNGRSESNPVSRFVAEIDRQYFDNPLRDPHEGIVTDGCRPSFSFSSKPASRDFAFNGRQASLSGRKTVVSGSTAPARPVFTKPQQRVPDSEFVASPIMDLRAGQRVEHNRFGTGLLKEMISDGADVKALIDFDEYGEKTLLLKYAKIRIL